MKCENCGHVLVDGAMFCANCGLPMNNVDSDLTQQTFFKLTENHYRHYSISVNRENLIISGKFWHLKDKEFVRCKSKQDLASIKNFLGMGCLNKRSFKKCLLFIIGGSILEVVKMIVDKLTEWIDSINNYLQWIDRSISLPEWIDNTMNILAGICILLAVVFFFSKRKMIELSFTDKRICVPQESMSKNEYNLLYQSIQNAQKRTT